MFFPTNSQHSSTTLHTGTLRISIRFIRHPGFTTVKYQIPETYTFSRRFSPLPYAQVIRTQYVLFIRECRFDLCDSRFYSRNTFPTLVDHTAQVSMTFNLVGGKITDLNTRFVDSFLVFRHVTVAVLFQSFVDQTL